MCVGKRGVRGTWLKMYREMEHEMLYKEGR